MKGTDGARSGILAAGNWIIDHVKMIDEYPDQDALSFIGEQSTSNGGGPFNVLVDLARSGAAFPLAAAGLVGDDANGHLILRRCAALGIDTTLLGVSTRAPTSFTDVMTVGATGRRTFFHQVGANALFSGEEIDFSTSTARMFYLGYLLLLESLDRIFDDGTTGASRLLARARSAGLVTVVDLVSAQGGRFRDVIGPALPHTDVLFLNEYEAGRLLGTETRNPSVSGLVDAGKAIIEMGVGTIVVIHCPEFGVAVQADGVVAVQGSVLLPRENIRGAVGAGDAFAAGFLHGYHEGMPVPECLKRAVCVAAACLMDPTTSGGVNPTDECLALGDRFGFREATA